MKKRCTKCGKEKEATVEFFFRSQTGKGGLMACCKVCKQAASKRWVETHRDHANAYARQRTQTHPEVKAYRQAYGKVYQQQNKEKIREIKRKYYTEHSEQIKEQTRHWLQQHPEYVRRKSARYYHQNKEKARARWVLGYHLRKGDVKKPSACSRCGETKPSYQICGHHHDYSRPLDVTWLCRKCHRIEHLQEIYHESLGNYQDQVSRP